MRKKMCTTRKTWTRPLSGSVACRLWGATGPCRCFWNAYPLPWNVELALEAFYVRLGLDAICKTLNLVLVWMIYLISTRLSRFVSISAIVSWLHNRSFGRLVRGPHTRLHTFSRIISSFSIGNTRNTHSMHNSAMTKICIINGTYALFSWERLVFSLATTLFNNGNSCSEFFCVETYKHVIIPCHMNSIVKTDL
jgi:hypothetical protein